MLAVDIVAGLDLLYEVGWAGAPIEEGHFRASRLMQQHPLYTQDSMLCSAHVATAVALFSRTVDEMKRTRLQATIDRTSSPGSVPAKNATALAL